MRDPDVAAVLPFMCQERDDRFASRPGVSAATALATARAAPPAQRWRARSRQKFRGRSASEREDLIRLSAELGRVRGSGPARIELRELLVGRPTGDGTSLSDVNRNGVIPELCDQLAHRRHADAFDLI